MSIKQYYIAGLYLDFDIDESLQVDDADGRLAPFAAKGSNVADYTLKYVQSHNPEYSEKHQWQSSIVGKSFDDVLLPYQWHFYDKNDRTEGILIEYFNHDNLLWVDAQLKDDNVLVTYCTKANCSLSTIYVFPLFNLLLSKLLSFKNGLLIHSSTVNDGKCGALFTAVSGTGKSTMAKIWQSCGATIINDDMIVLRVFGSKVVAYNIPMLHYIDNSKQTELNAIFLLSQMPENQLKRLVGAQTVVRFMANTIHQSYSPQAVKRHLSVAEKIYDIVPIYSLGFKPDADVVQLIRNEVFVF